MTKIAGAGLVARRAGAPIGSDAAPESPTIRAGDEHAKSRGRDFAGSMTLGAENQRPAWNDGHVTARRLPDRTRSVPDGVRRPGCDKGH